MDLDKAIVNGFSNSEYDDAKVLRDRRVRGEYDRRKFLLSLSSDIHEELQLSNGEPGQVFFSPVSSKKAQAFSVYLHETIHWWQHIGSFAGFMQTCIFPASIHLNFDRLEKILRVYGAKKSVFRLLEQEASKAFSPSIDDLNVIVNNMKDAEFFVAAIQFPTNLEIIANDKFYEGRGHSFGLAYTAVASALSGFDAQFDVLPNPTAWQQSIQARKVERAIEYYYGSPVRVPPIGLNALFEGQARFSQMQYLYQASGATLEWDDFEEAGMFGEIYVEAFTLFLELTGIAFPDNVLSSEVGLFLIICDLAINPTDGFPLPIRSFETFVDDVDPGTRFLRLCRAVGKNREISDAVKDFSEKDYLQVSTALCNLAHITHPNVALDAVLEWTLHSPNIDKIVREGNALKFENENMAMRLLVAKFVAFCKDKRSNPEFFCWPGAGMTESKAHARATSLFQDHQSLFTNRADKRGIYPRVIKGIDPQQCVDTLTQFYQWIVLYEITRQWILENGTFELSFDWLSDGDNEEVFQWANKLFQSSFGIRPDEFEILR